MAEFDCSIAASDLEQAKRRIEALQANADQTDGYMGMYSSILPPRNSATIGHYRLSVSGPPAAPGEPLEPPTAAPVPPAPAVTVLPKIVEPGWDNVPT